MFVSSVVVWLRLLNCPSTREKIPRVERIVQKLRANLNVSIATVGGDEQADVCVLGVAAVGRARRDVGETLERVLEALAVHPEAQILGEPEWK